MALYLVCSRLNVSHTGETVAVHSCIVENLFVVKFPSQQCPLKGPY